MRDGRWKYHARTFPDAEALYDLTGDPDERLDLAAAHPEVVGEMRWRLAEYLAPRHAGRFVAVRDAAPGEPLAVLIEWDGPVEWGPARHLGLARTEWHGARQARFEGLARGGLELLAHFEPPPGARVRVRLESGGRVLFDAEPPRPESLAAWRNGAGPSVALLEGGGRAGAPRPATADVDPQKLEALRELGYLE